MNPSRKVFLEQIKSLYAKTLQTNYVKTGVFRFVFCSFCAWSDRAQFSFLSFELQPMYDEC